MLRRLRQHFELILFTSGESTYAHAALNKLEQEEKFFDYRLTKENCIRLPEQDFGAKDLRILCSNRRIEDILIVDNSISNYMLHLANGIPIKDFTGDKNDDWFKYLEPYLMSFLDCENVQEKIKADLQLDTLLEYINNGSRNPLKTLNATLKQRRAQLA